MKIESSGAVSGGAMTFRTRGQLSVTVIVKATFILVHEAEMTLAEPSPINVAELHHRNNPMRSVRETSDLVPYLGRADVVLTGSAHAPPGRPTPVLSVRLAVFRERALLDKTLHVFGDRAPGGEPRPFQEMPLVYERAYGGVGFPDNPIGVGYAVGGEAPQKLPNLVDPSDPKRAAGFGPISRTWPVRKKLLGKTDRKALEQPIAEIPDAFDWAYYQSAPADQRIDFLRGDEYVVLDGLHPTLPRLQSRLPGARAAARVYRPGEAPRAIELRADTLRIDGDAECCSLTWRGVVPVKDEAALDALTILVGLELGGRELAWPDALPSEADGPIEELSAAELEESEGDEEDPLDNAATRIAGDRADDRRPPAPIQGAPPSAPLEGTVALPSDQGEVASRRAPTPFAPVGQARPLEPPPSRITRPTEPTSRELESPLEGTVALPSDQSEAASRRVPIPFAPPSSSRIARPTEPTSRELESPLEGTVALPSDQSEAASRRVPIPFAPPSPGAAPAPASSRGSAVPLPGAPWSGAVAQPPVQPSSSLEGTIASFYDAEEAPTRPREAAPPSARPRAAEERPAPGPEIAPRRSDFVPFVNTTPFSVATLSWQVKPPRDTLTVVIKGTFDLVPQGPAAARERSDHPTGDVHAGGDPQRSLAQASDFAVFKQRADVTLLGHAHAPGGSSAAMQVSFRFGSRSNRFERTINVFGERQWQKALIAIAPTEPRPFAKMPLTYERAFGGPRHDANPVGMGHGAEPGPDGIARLPNLELVDHAIDAPTDTPPRAGFGPIAPLWKERWSKLGTYDQRWFKSRWPYFPEDFDWAFFQAAPPEQRLDFLRGDEPFEIVGVHPKHPNLWGKLPGVRARCFAQRTTEAGGEFLEVVLRLDTAAFDTDEMKVNLVWRGLVEVSDEDAPEIARLFVMQEDLKATPATLAEARERFLAAAIPAAPVPESPGAAAANDDAAAKAAEDAADAAADRHPELVKIEAELEKHKKTIAGKLRDMGVENPEALIEGEGAPPARPAPPDPGAVLAYLDRAGADDEVKAELADVMKLLSEKAEAAEKGVKDEAPEPPPDPALREQVVARLASGEPFDDLDLAGADLRDLDFGGRSLARANLMKCNLRGASFARANLAGAQMSGADLTDAALVEADLSGADLTEAILEKTRLDGAGLDAADLTGAKGRGASFARARGKRAAFVQGAWESALFDGADLPDADFTGASLPGAAFRGAKIPEVRLYDARGGGAVFDGAVMTNARGGNAALTRCSFKNVAAPGSVWDGAILNESTFQGAALPGASFQKASCLKANFAGADLVEAHLRRGKFGGAIFVRANLMKAVFEGADLTIADLRGANLYAAGFWKARMQDARIDGTLLGKSSLARRPS